LPVCLGGFALLWRGWLKIFKNNSQGGGSLAAVGRVDYDYDYDSFHYYYYEYGLLSLLLL
jgi:hypothetical protein